MPIRRVTPAEAVELVAQGWIYVDVRTTSEFDAGHPRGAYNLPLMQQGAAGRVANPDFVAIAEGALGKDARIVLGCAGGTRARRAAELLAGVGFEELAEMPTGFSGGEKDATGRVVTPGWKDAGLPIDQKAEPGHHYDDLAAKVREGKP